MIFDGDVIILDPANVAKDEEDWQLVLADTYDRVELEKIGIDTYISFDAMGESRAKVVNEDGNVLGEFCTDSCLICILRMEDLLKYNPQFEDHIKYPGSCTLISNFKGEILIEEGENVSVNGTGTEHFHVEWI